MVALHLGDPSIAAEMLSVEPDADWQDETVNPHWAQVDEYTRGLLEARHGVVAERSVLCLDMSWDKFLTAKEQLQPSRYRPKAGVFGGNSEAQSVVVWQRLPRPAVRPTWDPVQRTMFIEYFAQWSGSLEKLADPVRHLGDAKAPFVSGLCLAVGNVPGPSAKGKQAWRRLFETWHQESPEGGVHSASGWALRTLGITAHDFGKEQRRCESFAWQRTPMGLTMIRIPAGELEAEDGDSQSGRKRLRVAEGYWLSDCEVTAGLFLKFLNDPDAERPEELDGIALPKHG